MKILSALSLARKGVKHIIKNHKKELVIGILLLILFVAVATAAIYNSMHIQSTVGVEPTPTP